MPHAVRPEGNWPAFTEVAKVSVTGLFFCSGIEHAKCMFPASDIFKKAILKTVFFKKNKQTDKNTENRNQNQKLGSGGTHTPLAPALGRTDRQISECEDVWSTE